MFLKHAVPGNAPSVYIGTPAWGNYQPLFHLAGLAVRTYKYYDAEKGEVDFQSVLDTVRSAPERGIFVFQSCCHNPTAVDFTTEQWRILAAELKARSHLPLFDIAYQGMGNGLEDDVFAVRCFAEFGFEMLVCQSFSKNLGLYGERVGALHVTCPTSTVAAAVHDQLRCLVRWEFSSSPAYGARIVNLVLSNNAREASW